MNNRYYSEHLLLQRLILKEQSAWKELYDSYSGSLAYICMRYIKEQEDVRDVLQNSFVKMFHSIGSFEFRGNGSLKAWMVRIVVNEALKCLRNSSGIIFSAADDLPDLTDEDEPDLNEISQSEIMEMIRMLPNGYRAVFNLYVFEEKSHREIAELLGIAENSSASQFHRAKKMLAQKIKAYKKLKTGAL